ncbi:MAG: hypothetical protein PHS73_01060 [Candidatus Peribacteraceae bacterium]|nr:hypothetical protein [Candidatus Peribacteraceae bacterium]
MLRAQVNNLLRRRGEIERGRVKRWDNGVDEERTELRKCEDAPDPEEEESE